MLVIAENLVVGAIVLDRRGGDACLNASDFGPDAVRVRACFADEPLAQGRRDGLGDALAGRAGQGAREAVRLGVLDAEGRGV